MDTGGARGKPARRGCSGRTHDRIPRAPAVAQSTEVLPTLPRHGDVVPAEERPSGQEHPTDPLFDRAIRRHRRSGIRAGSRSRAARQGIVDARSAQKHCCAMPTCVTPRREYGRQNEATRVTSRSAGQSQGLAPAGRQSRSVRPRFRSAGEARTAANFIVQPDRRSRSDDRPVPRAARRQGRRGAQARIARDVARLSRESPPALASGSLRMLSDSAAFAASPYATHDGAFQPSTCAASDGGLACNARRLSPMHRTDHRSNSRALSPWRVASARSRVAGTTRRDRIAHTACGRSHRATGACSRSLRWRSRSPRPIGSSRQCASSPTCCSVA